MHTDAWRGGRGVVKGEGCSGRGVKGGKGSEGGRGRRRRRKASVVGLEGRASLSRCEESPSLVVWEEKTCWREAWRSFIPWSTEGAEQGRTGLDVRRRVEEWREIGNHGLFSQQERRPEEEHGAGHTTQRDADPGG